MGVRKLWWCDYEVDLRGVILRVVSCNWAILVRGCVLGVAVSGETLVRAFTLLLHRSVRPSRDDGTILVGDVVARDEVVQSLGDSDFVVAFVVVHVEFLRNCEGSLLRLV